MRNILRTSVAKVSRIWAHLFEMLFLKMGFLQKTRNAQLFETMAMTSSGQPMRQKDTNTVQLASPAGNWPEMEETRNRYSFALKESQRSIKSACFYHRANLQQYDHIKMYQFELRESCF